MNQLGMYWLICPVCSGNLKPENKKAVKAELTQEQENRLDYPGPSKKALRRIHERIAALEAKANEQKALKNYKITSSRWDISEHTIETFQATSDEETRQRFQKHIDTHSWDRLKLFEYHERTVEMWEKRQ